MSWRIIGGFFFGAIYGAFGDPLLGWIPLIGPFLSTLAASWSDPFNPPLSILWTILVFISTMMGGIFGVVVETMHYSKINHQPLTKQKNKDRCDDCQKPFKEGDKVIEITVEEITSTGSQGSYPIQATIEKRERKHIECEHESTLPLMTERLIRQEMREKGASDEEIKDHIKHLKKIIKIY